MIVDGVPGGVLQPRRPKSLYRRQNTTPREVVEARMMLEREATAEELEALGT